MKRANSARFFAPSLLVGMFALMAMYGKEFFHSENIYNVIYTAALLWPAVAGMHLLLLTGHFDLSSGGTAALAGVLVASVAVATGSSILAIIAGILTGVLIGLMNALVVVNGRIHSLIATLAVLGGARSVALVLTDGTVIAGLPPQFESIARKSLSGIEAPVILASASLLFLAFLAPRSVAIRRLYQVGSNVLAADICGIATKRVVTAAFVAASGGATITGILGCARTMTGSPLAYESLAIDALTACVIGGARLEGGRGTAVGAAIGTLIVVVTRNVVVLLGISVYWRALFIGAILLSAALMDRLTARGNALVLSRTT